MRVVPEQPVDAPLAAQYRFATARGDYVRHPTVVICSCGDVCEFCAPEPAPTPGRWQRLRAALLRKEAT